MRNVVLNKKRDRTMDDEKEVNNHKPFNVQKFNLKDSRV
jgi:hypothetical protein